MINPNPDDEKKIPCTPKEVIRALGIENLGETLKEKINELNDDAATQALTRLDSFIDLIKKADKCYYEVMGLIVEDELALIDQMGYTYRKNHDGSIEFYSEEDIGHSRDEPGKTPLTEAAYYDILYILSSNFRNDGIPSKYRVAYSHLNEAYQELLNNDAMFGMAMEQARPYLSSIQGVFLITQYYTNTQLLQSLLSLFGAF